MWSGRFDLRNRVYLEMVDTIFLFVIDFDVIEINVACLNIILMFG